MEVNADFSARVAVHPADNPWRPSPMPGVERMMLDRLGDEVARATTIVRFAKGSAFSPHTHGGGEEFLVLDGVFQDEHGDYPAGSYVRNPPTSHHTPAAADGCTLLVKLWQFDPEDRTHVRIDTGKMPAVRDADRPGVAVCPLFADGREAVRIEDWEAEARIALDLPGGAELFVLDGSFEDGGETFRRWSWLRLPRGASLKARAGSEGVRVWIKIGHLARDPQAPAVQPAA